jgi:hypothetical protein
LRLLRPCRVAVAVLAVLALAGCSGSGGERADAQSEREARESTTQAPESTAPPPAPVPTLVSWRSAYRLWLDEVRLDLRDVGLAVNDPKALASLRQRGLETGFVAKRLESLDGCARLEDTLVPAPKHVRPTLRLLRQACGPLARGADFVRGGVAERRKADLRRAVRAWRSAANVVEAANRKLRVPEHVEALPLPVEDGNTRISRVEPLFTRVTRLMGEGGKYAARCWSESDWNRIEREQFGENADLAGFATEAYQNLNLAPEICETLARLAYSGERPAGDEQLDAAFAILVLMHETAHLGEGYEFFTREEAEAECWGMQFVRPAARALGLEASYAAELADRYWREVYPLVEAKYRSRECRNDGRLDVRPQSDVWP